LNPADLARRIEAMVVDYDVNTALTALDIAKLLVNHRKLTELDFNAHSSTQSEPENS
jgi:hypothetical protein